MGQVKLRSIQAWALHVFLVGLVGSILFADKCGRRGCPPGTGLVSLYNPVQTQVDAPIQWVETRASLNTLSKVGQDGEESRALLRGLIARSYWAGSPKTLEIFEARELSNALEAALAGHAPILVRLTDQIHETKKSLRADIESQVAGVERAAVLRRLVPLVRFPPQTELNSARLMDTFV